jgi:hypothetical protein
MTPRVCGVAMLLLFVSAAVFGQCSTKIDPPRKSTIGVPGERVCCSLGAQSGIDPKNLSGHVYGNQAQYFAQTAGRLGGEPDGYIYTSGAGLVDIGHVRDNADLVFYVWTQLAVDAQHVVYVNDQAAVPTIPADKDQLLGLAGAIVFINSWAHELKTWGETDLLSDLHTGMKTQDFSAFSPEDMSSNIVGIQVATQAIKAGGTTEKAFSEEVDAFLPAIMVQLGALSPADTDKVLSAVQFDPLGGITNLTAKWWMYDHISPGDVFVRLLRRNFDGAPWKSPLAPQTDPPAWMSTSRFTPYYSQFLYFVNDKADVDATEVPKTTAYALAKGFTSLEWGQTPAQGLAPDAVENDLVGGSGPCLTTKDRKVITSGQFSNVKINVDPGGSLDVIWSFSHATDFIRSAFVNPKIGGNADMDGPVLYSAPPAAALQK